MARDESEEFLLLDSDGPPPQAYDGDLMAGNQAV
jgi:hypothetical protein